MRERKKSLINLHAVKCIVFLTSQHVTFTRSLAWPPSAWCHGCGRSPSHYDISSNGSLVLDTCTWSHPYNNSIWNCYFCICVHYNSRISVCVASERQRCDQRRGVRFKRVCVCCHTVWSRAYDNRSVNEMVCVCVSLWNSYSWLRGRVPRELRGAWFDPRGRVSPLDHISFHIFR